MTEAIEVGREGVAVTPGGRPDRAGFLANLGHVFLARFERTGDMEALSEAIQVGRDAVAAAGGGHPDAPRA